MREANVNLRALILDDGGILDLIRLLRLSDRIASPAKQPSTLLIFYSPLGPFRNIVQQAILYSLQLFEEENNRENPADNLFPEELWWRSVTGFSDPH